MDAMNISEYSENLFVTSMYFDDNLPTENDSRSLSSNRSSSLEQSSSLSSIIEIYRYISTCTYKLHHNDML